MEELTYISSAQEEMKKNQKSTLYKQQNNPKSQLLLDCEKLLFSSPCREPHQHQIVPGVSKKYPLLTGNRNETIRYHNSRSERLNLSIFNLESHTLHLKIVCQTPEIQACKVKIYSAPETRGFVKGPSPDLISQAYCKRIRTLTLSFSFEKNYTLKCFNCAADNYSFEESICALHSIPSVKEEEKSTCTFILEMWHVSTLTT